LQICGKPTAGVVITNTTYALTDRPTLSTNLLHAHTGIKQYGEELRPCKLTTHVKSYQPAKNEFMFEKRLNDYVASIVMEHSSGRPTLVFCK
jgi:ATP-dependent DNA helicase HFM1/MER3